MDVTVVGGGVIGMTVAHEAARAGHRVTVIAEHDHRASTSAVAAAIWFPHAVAMTERLGRSGATAYRKLVELADDPATGVRLREGTVLSRQADPDLSWTSAVPRCREATEVPPGSSGMRCALPLAVTDVYLDWLRRQITDLAVRVETRAVTSVADAPGDAVVVAAGLGSGRLLGGDPELYPIRGQVVRLANPGLTDWWLDGDNPAGLTYVVPRDRDVVCGGTDDIGSWDLGVHDDVEAAILKRAVALVPALAGRPVLSRAAGLRPARSTVRLERVAGHDRPVIACYGHGGSGFTLSWGEAADVVRLLG